MRARTTLGTILLAALASATAGAQARSDDGAPRIALGIPDRAVFNRSAPVPVRFRTEEAGYVAIFRIDTDGRFRVLYPAGPADDNFVEAGYEYRVPNPYGYAVDYTFAIDDYPGIGYVFAVLSHDPFDFAPYTLNGHWEFRTVGNSGRITGDPYVAVSEILDYILPPGYTDYGFDVVPYYVEARYEYQRFVCYDCHAYVEYPVWDPYRYWCATFQVVIYDYPPWYPGSLYPGTQVVLPVGARVQPQYLIRGRTHTDPQVVHVTRRGTPATPQPGVRGRDLGGVGSVPAPKAKSEGGGIGSVFRRLFGGSDAASSRRPTSPKGVAPTQKPTEKPKLERRGKVKKPDQTSTPPGGQAVEGRRPGTTPATNRAPAGRAPTVRPATPVPPPRAKPSAKPTERRTPASTRKPSGSTGRRPG
jgi:hypothetical protein